MDELEVSFPFVADCTTYAPLIGDLRDKRIWIHRDPEQCRKSSETLFGQLDDEMWNVFVALAKDYESKATLVVRFDELFDENTLSQMWYHVFPKHMVFPKLKAIWLAKMNVQRHKAAEVFTAESCQTIL